jgi:NADH:ubiquinone oxidoreductase subunit F (NADH-binding)
MRHELIGQVELAGLSGRGGAGFPTARKLAAVAARRNAMGIGNGTEGEPVSAKDKVLMAQSPHLVLDGAVAAASLVGATEAIIVAHPAAADIVTAALRERRRARIDGVRLLVIPAAEAFVAGEASAVVHWLEHRIPKPKATPRRLSERGLHGRPTLVQNVETLAHLPSSHGTERCGFVPSADQGSQGRCWSRSPGRSAIPACTRSRSACRSARSSTWLADHPGR